MKLQGNYQHMQPIVPAQAIPFNREPSSVNTPPFNEGHQTATGPSHFDQSYIKNKSLNEDSQSAASPSHPDQSYIKSKSFNEAYQSARGPSMSDIKHMSLNEGGSSSPMDMLNKFYADLPFDMNADLNFDQSTNQIAPSATDFNPFSTNQVATPGTEINPYPTNQNADMAKGMTVLPDKTENTQVQEYSKAPTKIQPTNQTQYHSNHNQNFVSYKTENNQFFNQDNYGFPNSNYDGTFQNQYSSNNSTVPIPVQQQANYSQYNYAPSFEANLQYQYMMNQPDFMQPNEFLQLEEFFQDKTVNQQPPMEPKVKREPAQLAYNVHHQPIKSESKSQLERNFDINFQAQVPSIQNVSPQTSGNPHAYLPLPSFQNVSPQTSVNPHTYLLPQQTRYTQNPAVNSTQSNNSQTHKASHGQTQATPQTGKVQSVTADQSHIERTMDKKIQGQKPSIQNVVLQPAIRTQNYIEPKKVNNSQPFNNPQIYSTPQQARSTQNPATSTATQSSNNIQTNLPAKSYTLMKSEPQPDKVQSKPSKKILTYQIVTPQGNTTNTECLYKLVYETEVPTKRIVPKNSVTITKRVLSDINPNSQPTAPKQMYSVPVQASSSANKENIAPQIFRQQVAPEVLMSRQQAVPQTFYNSSYNNGQQRSVIKPEYQSILKQALKKELFPDRGERIRLGQLCQLKPRQVQIWFQNQRSKRKRRSREANARVSGQRIQQRLVTAQPTVPV